MTESARKAAPSYWTLLRSIIRGVWRSYMVWRMNVVASKGTLYSCVTCGMALDKPCKHWTELEEPSVMFTCRHGSFPNPCKACQCVYYKEGRP
jgi:hypothetical protein